MPRLNCQNPIDENQILNEPAAGRNDDQPARLAVRKLRLPGHPDRLRGRPAGRAQPVHRVHHRARRAACTPRATNSRRSSPPSTTTSRPGAPRCMTTPPCRCPPTTCSCSTGACTGRPPRPGGMDELAVVQEGRRIHRHDAQQEQVRARHADVRDRLAERRRRRQPRHAAGVRQHHGPGERVRGARPNGTPKPPIRTSPTPTPAACTHSVWYTDQQSVAVRVALAESLGLGVGLWHLGSEDQSIWELPSWGAEAGAARAQALGAEVLRRIVRPLAVAAPCRRSRRTPRGRAARTPMPLGPPSQGGRPMILPLHPCRRSCWPARPTRSPTWKPTSGRSAWSTRPTSNARSRAGQSWASANPAVDAYAVAHQLVEDAALQLPGRRHRAPILTESALRARTLAQLVTLVARRLLRGAEPRPRERRRPRPRRAHLVRRARSPRACTRAAGGSPSTSTASPTKRFPVRRPASTTTARWPPSPTMCS